MSIYDTIALNIGPVRRVTIYDQLAASQYGENQKTEHARSELYCRLAATITGRDKDPKIDPPGHYRVPVSETISGRVTGVDRDGDPLINWSIIRAPLSGIFSIEENTGEWSYKPTVMMRVPTVAAIGCVDKYHRMTVVEIKFSIDAAPEVPKQAKVVEVRTRTAKSRVEIHEERRELRRQRREAEAAKLNNT